MFDEPTVAQRSSITATFACRNERWYSWIDTPPSSSWPYSARDRVVQQAVLDARLQQQRHLHAARRRGDQRAPEADAGKEIRVGDDDLAPRRADRREIRALDVAAMAQVVADDELARSACPTRVGRRALGKQRHVGAAQLRRARRSPTRAASCSTIGASSGPFEADGEIDARRLVARRVHVVDDVDAADERDAAVDVTELAVQPAQAVASGSATARSRAGTSGGRRRRRCSRCSSAGVR